MRIYLYLPRHITNTLKEKLLEEHIEVCFKGTVENHRYHVSKNDTDLFDVLVETDALVYQPLPSGQNDKELSWIKSVMIKLHRPIYEMDNKQNLMQVDTHLLACHAV